MLLVIFYCIYAFCIKDTKESSLPIGYMLDNDIYNLLSVYNTYYYCYPEDIDILIEFADKRKEDALKYNPDFYPYQKFVYDYLVKNKEDIELISTSNYVFFLSVKDEILIIDTYNPCDYIQTDYYLVLRKNSPSFFNKDGEYINTFSEAEDKLAFARVFEEGLTNLRGRYSTPLFNCRDQIEAVIFE